LFLIWTAAANTAHDFFGGLIIFQDTRRLLVDKKTIRVVRDATDPIRSFALVFAQAEQFDSSWIEMF
jgi:hypothetical protein